MLRSLKKDLTALFVKSSNPDLHSTETLESSVCIIMLTLCLSDDCACLEEMTTLRRILLSHFDIDSNDIDDFIERKRREVDTKVSLHKEIAHIRKQSLEQKTKILERLWQLAYADDRLDPQEEALIRRFADTLGIPHSQYIRTKLLHS